MSWVEGMKTARQIGAAALLPGLLLLNSCSAPAPVPSMPRFTEEADADFIARYYSDETSYVLKPSLTDGLFRSICNRTALLDVARQQPRRELAVVVLVHYPSASTEETTKLAWVNDLKVLGYRRIVFLRGGNTMRVKGLPVLESPQVPATLAGK
jgi:hypothetical protein